MRKSTCAVFPFRGQRWLHPVTKRLQYASRASLGTNDLHVTMCQNRWTTPPRPKRKWFPWFPFNATVQQHARTHKHTHTHTHISGHNGRAQDAFVRRYTSKAFWAKHPQQPSSNGKTGHSSLAELKGKPPNKGETKGRMGVFCKTLVTQSE